MSESEDDASAREVSVSEACGCEHAVHDDGGGHAYMKVRAGVRRAQHVGAVCDDCADSCVSEYLLPDGEPGGERRLT